MISLALWQSVLAGMVIAVAAVLLLIWWGQQTFRWPLIAAISLLAAPGFSWWSARTFQIPDYRAGCDALCPGFRGAPVPVFAGETAGGQFSATGFALNSLVYLVLLLAWGAILYALLARGERLRGLSGGSRLLVALVSLAAPFVLAPIYLPPPEAHVRGDPQRVAINAQREVYLYDNQAGAPVLRVGLEDVRPRHDGSPGMRVCLRAYTFFYLPIGHMYLDMAPEGVHSTGGGMLSEDQSCWN
ncbi:MAG TPA: hypothetical protein VGA61_19725 [Anaerolineae bacterium]